MTSLNDTHFQITVTAPTDDAKALFQRWKTPSLRGESLNDWRRVTTDDLGGDEPSDSELATTFRVYRHEFVRNEGGPKPCEDIPTLCVDFSDDATISKKDLEKLIDLAAKAICKSASLLEGLRDLQRQRDALAHPPLEAFHQLELSTRYLQKLLKSRASWGAARDQADSLLSLTHVSSLHGLTMASIKHAECLITNAGLTPTEEWISWTTNAKAWRP
ncbi:hypothetical protein BD324DRAFT_682021 [Kockovaella imperatae]|uniref:Uncharacterized protein n=1 Tax=Kockovaella imperatae TaxID=4999 RepID=A0A1Y1UCY1_9TREE|nr:hypothetical protein BD324DRAFT_682021 [Kockovaella imperatae]ORX35862.1 hypothetical protein BD324DRAFT_682021 [Kockovaella imperatae]